MTIDNSINYNVGAAVALNTLNATASSLGRTQNYISTGKLINSADDNPSVWATATRTASDAGALDAVVQSLQRKLAVNSTALNAGQQIVDLLNQMKTILTTAADWSTSSAARGNLNTDFQTLITEINNVSSQASFNGANLIRTNAAAISGLASTMGGVVVNLTLHPQSMALVHGTQPPNAIMTFSSHSEFSNTFGPSGVAMANTLLGQINQSITNATSAVAALGDNDQTFNEQLTFVQQLQQSLNGGVSNMVDADMAKESAQLQAFQAKQQLGVQALAIANSSKSALLSLFR